VGQITLNAEECLKLVNSTTADAETKAIGAAGLALFKAAEAADEGLKPETRAIILKLSHEIAAVIYGEDD